MPTRLFRAVCVTLALSAVAFGQSAVASPVQPGAHVQLNSLPESPVPNDPLELVAGETQVVQTPEQRARIVGLLGRARHLSNLRSYAYDLKTTFTSIGQSPFDGSWQMEDISPSADAYRWTAQGSNYSVVNLYANRILYSNIAGGTLPLRLGQVRGAIFFAFLGPTFLQSALVRTATASLNGTEVTCALFSGGANAPTATPARRWEETEYCIDPKSGLLATYSAAPGIYMLYDYSRALRFHDRILPGKITITEAGNSIIEVHLESVTDAEKVDPELFKPSSGLTSIGVGSMMSPPWRFPIFVPSGTVSTSSVIQPVIVHGVLTPDGQLTEAEVLQTGNSSLAQSALNVAKEWHGGRGTAPGATPQQHEVFINVKFVVPGS